MDMSVPTLVDSTTSRLSFPVFLTETLKVFQKRFGVNLLFSKLDGICYWSKSPRQILMMYHCATSWKMRFLFLGFFCIVQTREWRPASSFTATRAFPTKQETAYLLPSLFSAALLRCSSNRFSNIETAKNMINTVVVHVAWNGFESCLSEFHFMENWIQFCDLCNPFMLILWNFANKMAEKTHGSIRCLQMKPYKRAAYSNQRSYQM